jgi:hypothetical protein
MEALTASCSHHPARAAVGICVRCARAMCSDCITKIDGINHCRDCLAQLQGAQRAAQIGPTLRVPGWLALSVGAIAISSLAWWMLEVMMPGAAGP